MVSILQACYNHTGCGQYCCEAAEYDGQLPIYTNLLGCHVLYECIVSMLCPRMMGLEPRDCDLNANRLSGIAVFHHPENPCISKCLSIGTSAILLAVSCHEGTLPELPEARFGIPEFRRGPRCCMQGHA